MTEKTLFQKIADREIPADILFEDDLALAFRDIQPVAPTHFLVVPKKPIVSASDIEMEDEALIGHLFTVARTVATSHGLTDYRLVMNSGASAGQSVFHLHLHVLGGRSFSWPPG